MQLSGTVGIILVLLLLWVFMGTRQTTTVGHDIQLGVHDVAHDAKNLGRDAAASIRSAVQ